MWLFVLFFASFFPDQASASGAFDVPTGWTSLPVQSPLPERDPLMLSARTPRCGAGVRTSLPLLPDGPYYRHTSASVSHGSALLLEAIAGVAEVMHRDYPEIDPLFVGRLNQPGGERNKNLMHQDGLDGDIGIYTLDGEQAGFGRAATPSTLDKEHTWAEIKAFFDTGRVKWILLDQSLVDTLRVWLQRTGLLSESRAAQLFPAAGTQRYLTSDMVMHAPGHKNHIHVHMKCVDEQD